MGLPLPGVSSLLRGRSGGRGPGEGEWSGWSIRDLLFALILVSVAGLGVELFFLEHYEEPLQWTPLVTLTATAVGTVWVWRRPDRRVVKAYRVLMVAAAVVAVAGMWFHYEANAALELEMAPEIAGRALLWEALHGGVPALAPGVLLQLGLIGLIATWRHPTLKRP